MECFRYPLDISHMSTWETAPRQYLEVPAKKINTLSDEPLVCDTENIGTTDMLSVGLRGSASRTLPPCGDPRRCVLLKSCQSQLGVEKSF